MKNIFLTFNGPALGPEFGPVNERPYLFIVISVVIHALVLLLLTNLPRSPLGILSVKDKPLDIEIVELPETIPLAGELKKPKKITAYAQRDQSVEKEEYPMKTGRAAVLIPPSQAGAPSIIHVEPVAKGDSKGSRAEKEAKGESRAKTKEVKAVVDEADAITFKPIPVPDSAGAKVRGDKGSGAEAREGFTLMPTDSMLHQIARQDSSAGVESPKEGSGTTLLLNTSDFRFQKYFIAVKRRIEFFWDYPPLAARNGQQGRLKIDFVIQKDGSIRDGDINILKSSNYPILDDAAQTALRLASPFNPFPEGFEAEEITVHGSFEYNLYRGR